MKPGEVRRALHLHINPDHDEVYGQCSMCVTSWDSVEGTVTGYIIIPMKGGTPIYQFVTEPFEAVEICGHAIFVNGTFLVQCIKCGEIIETVHDAPNLCDLCAK